jgi:hypothetical protein
LFAVDAKIHCNYCLGSFFNSHACLQQLAVPKNPDCPVLRVNRGLRHGNVGEKTEVQFLSAMNMLLVIVLGVLAFFALILTVLIGGNWLSWFFRRPKPRLEDSVRETRERLLNPRWDELEDHYGHPLPLPIKNLYKRAELLTQQDIAFRDGKGREWHVAEFLPADVEALNRTWPDLKKFKHFPFASDSLGDCFCIPLEGTDSDKCPVMIYHHDGSDVESVSTSLDEFLTWC